MHTVRSTVEHNDQVRLCNSQISGTTMPLFHTASVLSVPLSKIVSWLDSMPRRSIPLNSTRRIQSVILDSRDHESQGVADLSDYSSLLSCASSDTINPSMIPSGGFGSVMSPKSRGRALTCRGVLRSEIFLVSSAIIRRKHGGVGCKVQRTSNRRKGSGNGGGSTSQPAVL